MPHRVHRRRDGARWPSGTGASQLPIGGATPSPRSPTHFGGLRRSPPSRSRVARSPRIPRTPVQAPAHAPLAASARSLVAAAPPASPTRKRRGADGHVARKRVGNFQFTQFATRVDPPLPPVRDKARLSSPLGFARCHWWRPRPSSMLEKGLAGARSRARTRAVQGARVAAAPLAGWACARRAHARFWRRCTPECPIWLASAGVACCVHICPGTRRSAQSAKQDVPRLCQPCLLWRRYCVRFTARQ